MSRGFHFWRSQPLDRVTPPWLANPRPPAMSPHTNGTRYMSYCFISGKIKGGRDGGKRIIQRLNEESGRQENAVLSTWRWCKQGWLRLSQMTDHWPRPHSSLLTVLNKFNFIKIGHGSQAYVLELMFLIFEGSSFAIICFSKFDMYVHCWSCIVGMYTFISFAKVI